MCDPIWQVTPCSSRTSSRRGLYSGLALTEHESSLPGGLMQSTPSAVLMVMIDVCMYVCMYV